MIEVKFVKVHPDAQLPKPSHPALSVGDTGYDVFSVDCVTVPPRGSSIIPTGIKAGYITPGYWYKVEARSGLGFKHSLHPHPGIIDNSYRGDLGIKMYNNSDTEYTFKKGDRVAQLIFYPLIQAQVEWTEEGGVSVRGECGFGSSGR